MEFRLSMTAFSLFLSVQALAGTQTVAQTHSTVAQYKFSLTEKVYEGTQRSESLVWGPTAFSVHHGSFVIANGAKQTLLSLTPSAKGYDINSVKVNQRSFSAIQHIGTDVFALDDSGSIPFYRKIDLTSGSVTEERLIALPRAASLDPYYGFQRSLVNEFPAEQFEHKAISTFKIEASPLGKERTVVIDGVSFQFASKHSIGSSHYLGSTRDEFFFLVEEVESNPDIQVEQTVWKFKNDGTLVAKARVPLNERIVYVNQGVALDVDGSVYALIPKATSVEIVKLYFHKSLTSLLRQPDFILALPEPSSCKVTRAIAMEHAEKTVSAKIFLSKTNVSGPGCRGRDIPRHINAAEGIFDGVPYDWGGFDGLTQFTEFMSQGFAAGDVETSNVEACSKGLDCSGFVSRVWGTETKYGTATLAQISAVIQQKSLKPGDVLNRAGSHVVLFKEFLPQGIRSYESTKYNSYDRTLIVDSPWSRLQSYTPRRFNSICD